MRSSCFKSIAFSANLSLSALFLLTGGLAVAGPANATFDVLNRPALPTSGAGETMLAVANAGNRLVAVGDRGVVLLSDDAGKNWRQGKVPVSVTLTAVQFVNDRLGWAVGHLGVVLHTSDGGTTWALQLDGARAAALALQTAQATERAQPGRQTVEAQRLVNDGPDKPFLDVCFVNERTGFVVGAYNLAFRTDDGGRSWQSWMGRMVNPNGVHLYAIKAVGDALYVAGEQGLLLRSTDQGQHFAALNSPSKGTYFGLLSGRNGGLLLYGLQGRAYLSDDKALTWTQVQTGSQSSISSGASLHDGTIVLATQAGELVNSSDGGRSFRPARSLAGSPVTSLVQTSAGTVVATSMRGIRTLDRRALAQ